MSNLQTIKEEIEHLSAAERRELADWFAELEAQAWEMEIERDFFSRRRGHAVSGGDESRRASWQVQAV